jgi:23S rRNA pseudouridine1911/1915/1917 synthase
VNVLTTYTVTVPKDKAEIRLDKFLAKNLSLISRSRLKSLIKDAFITCEGVIETDPSIKVRAGQTYVINVPLPVSAIPIPQKIKLNVVYEDDDLIVIDKLAGMVVHPAAGHPDGTLVNALLAYCGSSLSGIGGVVRPGIVHRLDMGTSGLMVVAKNDVTHNHLSRQLEDRSLSRRYKALVWGVVSPREGKVDGAIGRNPANRKKMAVVEKGGKAALTHYRLIKVIGSRASLVDCRLSSGRTHQIRVHMAKLGHSVIGDPLYGVRVARQLKGLPSNQSKLLQELNYQLLHAFYIGFIHPRSGEKVYFESLKYNRINDIIKILEKIKH